MLIKKKNIFRNIKSIILNKSGRVRKNKSIWNIIYYSL
jgi:hypothetical protein